MLIIFRHQGVPSSVNGRKQSPSVASLSDAADVALMTELVVNQKVIVLKLKQHFSLVDIESLQEGRHRLFLILTDSGGFGAQHGNAGVDA